MAVLLGAGLGRLVVWHGLMHKSGASPGTSLQPQLGLAHPDGSVLGSGTSSLRSRLGIPAL